jgi:hypothetical protein
MEQHNWLVILHWENIYEYLSGMITNPLLEFQHLSYIDLSRNYFEGNHFSYFMVSLSKSRYLNL